MKVRILIGFYAGQIGTLEDSIQGTNWFNVRVLPNLRLALTEAEFVIIR
jgi:hypothetical protein